MRQVPVYVVLPGPLATSTIGPGGSIKSLAVCVSLCPSEEMKTYEDLKTFAMLNGSELCSYELAGHKYPSLPERFHKCPKLPVPPRRVHTTSASDMDQSLPHKPVRVYCGGLYIDHRLFSNTTEPEVAKETGEEVELDQDKSQALLVYATSATVFTVRDLVLLMLFMRKRVALTIALFHVAGKVFIHLPLLTLQPCCTFLALLIFWGYWVLVLLFLGTTGTRNRARRRLNGVPSDGDAAVLDLVTNAVV
ncbi:hypothetical protein CRUP_022133 [Coryphaenoides rupestris]|nr:hypothetical protein CRUP_022133 [Coryphaenoides rupestris]